MNGVISAWAPKSEKSRMVTFVYAGKYFFFQLSLLCNKFITYPYNCLRYFMIICTRELPWDLDDFFNSFVGRGVSEPCPGDGSHGILGLLGVLEC